MKDMKTCLASWFEWKLKQWEEYEKKHPTKPKPKPPTQYTQEALL